MNHDRTGEVIEDRECPLRCRGGWLTPADSDAPRPCPNCKSRTAQGLRREINDSATRPPSPLAQAAIDRAEWLDRHNHQEHQ